MMLFYLGTHMPNWLDRTDVPLFVSLRRLLRQKKWKPAKGRWALDSGGFTELNLHGRWTVGPAEFVSLVRGFTEQIGDPDWCAPQDWMCEPFVIAKTGLSVAEHQRRTVLNFCELRALAPDCRFAPVLQGWEPADYLRCVEAYRAVGVDLGIEPVVGLGTVCRRQGTGTARVIVRMVQQAVPGIRLHGFGFKTQGLAQLHRQFVSADSLAWSYNARRAGAGSCGRTSCANCLHFALDWRARLLSMLSGNPPEQTTMPW
jgi:hypothetical protein